MLWQEVAVAEVAVVVQEVAEVVAEEVEEAVREEFREHVFPAL